MSSLNTYCLIIALFITVFCPLEGQAMEIQTKATMGLKTFFTTDPNRPHWTENRERPMLIQVFYPTNAVGESLYFGANNEDMFIAGVGQRDAPFNALKPHQHPLIVLSHGNGSGVLQMAWLAQALVAEGFIVVGINHHGNTFMEPYLAQGFVHYWERAQDIRVSLDWILQDSPFKLFIDESQIAALGFSLGGYSVLTAAGGETDREYFVNTYCQSSSRDATCNPQSEFPDLKEAYAQLAGDTKVQASLKRESQSYRDNRIKGIIAISPPGHLITRKSISQITVPTLLLVGTEDSVTPAPSNAHYLAQIIPNAKYHEIESAEHYSMVSECTALGRQRMPRLCIDNNNLDRKAIHHNVNQHVTQFLRSLFYERPSDNTAAGSP